VMDLDLTAKILVFSVPMIAKSTLKSYQSKTSYHTAH
jgi:hypothetical protein